MRLVPSPGPCGRDLQSPGRTIIVYAYAHTVNPLTHVFLRLFHTTSGGMSVWPEAQVKLRAAEEREGEGDLLLSGVCTLDDVLYDLRDDRKVF